MAEIVENGVMREAQLIAQKENLQAQVDTWSGKSLDELPIDKFGGNPSLADSDRLRSTVPEEYRGKTHYIFWPIGDSDGDEPKAFEVLAVDETGRALTRTMVDGPYRKEYEYEYDTEYSIMPKERAFEVLTEVRSAVIEAQQLDAHERESPDGLRGTASDAEIGKDIRDQLRLDNERELERDAWYREMRFEYNNWQGQSISDLPLPALREFPDLADTFNLLETVPEEYRGQRDILERFDNDLEANEWFAVLAFDQEGNALTRWINTLEPPHENEPRYVVMSQEQVIEILKFEQVPVEGPELDAVDDQEMETLTEELGNPIPAEVGNSYNGPVIEMSDEVVYQRVGSEIVAHERAILVGHNLDGFEGGSDGLPVEIRYPQGDVGVVMPIKEQSFDGPEKDKQREHVKDRSHDDGKSL